MKTLKINKQCRLCKNKLEKVIDIGPQPLANQFVTTRKKKYYPLNLMKCIKCHFFQLQEAFDTKFLFSNYKYYSPENAEVKNHHLFILNKINKVKKINSKHKFLEIGSNTGSFIDLVKFTYNCFVVGIDPAKNLSEICKSKKIITETLEFNYKNSIKIKKKYGKFDFIILRHVFAHIDNLSVIVEGFKKLIKDNGVIYIENAYALDTFKNNEFDQIYHEHMSYLSLKPLINFFKGYRLNVFNAFKSKIHGGSISIFITKNIYQKINFKLNKILNEENVIYKKTFMRKFVNTTKQNKYTFVKFIKKIHKRKQTIATYGASAKGNTLLNYYGLNNKIIKYAFDNTDIKINKLLPGTHIKVVSSDSNLKYSFDYIIITAWNFLRTIVKKEISFLKKGGKFIIPNPLRIVSINNYKKFI
jgi:SAM-dependent methyltransferase